MKESNLSNNSGHISLFKYLREQRKETHHSRPHNNYHKYACISFQISKAKQNHPTYSRMPVLFCGRSLSLTTIAIRATGSRIEIFSDLLAIVILSRSLNLIPILLDAMNSRRIVSPEWKRFRITRSAIASRDTNAPPSRSLNGFIVCTRANDRCS